MIAALFIDPKGCYVGLDGVDPWDEQRDARTYRGPHPVVAHPPCARWCRLAGLVEKRYGHRRGDDGACFDAALKAVRWFGGVLEHPAYSDAWEWYGLPRPERAGGWSAPDVHGGRACHVEQGNYGHRARKATWLYAVGVHFLPLLWGVSEAQAWTSWGDFDAYPDVPRLSKTEAKATPPAFRDTLLILARTVPR